MKAAKITNVNLVENHFEATYRNSSSSKISLNKCLENRIFSKQDIVVIISIFTCSRQNKSDQDMTYFRNYIILYQANFLSGVFTAGIILPGFIILANLLSGVFTAVGITEPPSQHSVDPTLYYWQINSHAFLPGLNGLSKNDSISSLWLYRCQMFPTKIKKKIQKYLNRRAIFKL